MKELSGGIEHTNLGGTLLEDSEASIGQSRRCYRSSPLVFCCACDDSNPNARSVGESDGWRTLEDAGREFIDHSIGRIPDHGLERRVSALHTPRSDAKSE